MASVNDGGGTTRVFPQSMRHKRILDRAADDPNASLEELADDIPSATATLVENVLEKYGDPASEPEAPPAPDTATADDPAGTTDGPTESEEDGAEPQHDEDVSIDDAGSPADDSALPELSALTSRQRETIQAVAEHPNATQRELAAVLDVSAATISKRVNTIQGVDWSARHRAVDELLATNGIPDPDQTTMSPNDTTPDPAVQHLRDRVSELESRIDDQERQTPENSALEDPELIRKVMHSCLKSDLITEEEELQLLKTWIRGT